MPSPSGPAGLTAHARRTTPLGGGHDGARTDTGSFVGSTPRDDDALHRIVIVGGGAGGLVLAALAGDAFGRSGQAEVVLVDASLFHVWKPLLHEVAAGTLSSHDNEIGFLEQARRHHFGFHLGRLEAVDRTRRQAVLEPLVDDDGAEIAPRRRLNYDTLVLALGSTVDPFGTPGVAEHAATLDDVADARRFHRRLLGACARAELQGDEAIDIAIVGGGATGVELAAELTEAGAEIASHGNWLRQQPRPVRIHLIEGGPRLVPVLPESISHAVRQELERRGVEVRLGAMVREVGADHVQVGGERLPATLTVWAAGIRGPAVLEQLDGLELNRARQLVVRPTLQTTRNDAVFALGDCAFCKPDGDAPPVPARAQAAYQQAQFLAGAFKQRLAGRPLPAFAFHDRGSLLSLGQRDAAGTVDGAHHQWSVRGPMARFTYWVAQRRHLLTLNGVWRTLVSTVGGWLARRGQSRIKLH